MPGFPSLQGKRVLVVEDEYFIAVEVVQALQEAGVVVVGPASTVEEAGDLVAGQGSGLDGAILDVNLGGQMIWPVLEALAGQGVPAVLATGYNADAIPSTYLALPRCEKPVGMRDLLRLLERHIATGAS